MSKIKIKKGDVVRIISGANRGKEGKVLEVLIDAQKALVEGQNMVSRHTKPNTKNPQGGIIKKEAPIHISNLLVIDGKGNPTRIGRKVENGKIVRYSKKSGEVIK
ncbi:MAG: 50S ribosomal protein L24 [Bacteroidia bacterium]|nr:50S ribosomal protein L24 [Bacteroidia bacterium]